MTIQEFPHFLKMTSAFSGVGGAQICVQPRPRNFFSSYYQTMVYGNLHAPKCVAPFSSFEIGFPIGHEKWLDCSRRLRRSYNK